MKVLLVKHLVLGVGLQRSQQTLLHLILTILKDMFNYSDLRSEKTGSEKLSTLPTVSQLWNNRSRVKLRSVWIPEPLFLTIAHFFLPVLFSGCITLFVEIIPS